MTATWNERADRAVVILTVRESPVIKWSYLKTAFSTSIRNLNFDENPPSLETKASRFYPMFDREVRNKTVHHTTCLQSLRTQLLIYLGQLPAQALQRGISRFSHPTQRARFNNPVTSQPLTQIVTVCNKKLTTSCHSLWRQSTTVFNSQFQSKQHQVTRMAAG
jgi:hypothetical protein